MVNRYTYRSKAEKTNKLMANGFLKEEAEELATRSKYALTTPPYIKRLIRSRHAMMMNAKRYGWDESRYRMAILKQYSDIPDGFKEGKVNVWALIRELEARSKQRGDEYESPWRKTRDYKSRAKKQRKSITRQDMLKSLIEKARRKAQRTTGYRQRQAEEDLFALEQQYRKLFGATGV